MSKNTLIVVGVVVVLAVGAFLLFGDSTNAPTPQYSGVVFEDEHFLFDVDVDGQFTPAAITLPTTTATATATLTSANFGEIVFFNAASGTTQTLPAATAGAQITFVVGAAFADTNAIIDSAEGDNIEGSLIVAGAVVECDAEDQINFVADGEDLGDFVTLTSDGTSWHITGSNALTSAKLTCTDPS